MRFILSLSALPILDASDKFVLWHDQLSKAIALDTRGRCFFYLPVKLKENI